MSTMHRSWLVLVALFALGTSVGTVLARDTFTFENANDAKSWDQVQSQLDRIPDYIDQAMCGGVNKDISVEGKIAVVKGVPGHDSQWDGDVLNGMGKRNDNFQYPPDAKGLSTACGPGFSDTTKDIWDEGAHKYFPHKFAYPKFTDPPCRWRLEGGGDPPSPLNPDELFNYEELNNPPQDRQSPPVCQAFCTYLNKFIYRNCAQTEPVFDPDTGDYLFDTCVRYANFYICTDSEVRNGASCTPGVESNNELSNARACLGDNCRCGQSGGPMCPPAEGRQYVSYFRQYQASYERAGVQTDKGADKTSNSGPVACFGFYNEFDPMTTQTHAPDRRCVINFDISGYRESQKGKGETGKNSNVNDKDPLKPENLRNKDANAKDVWYLKLAYGFSLLNEKSFKDDYNQDFATVYQDIDNLDKATMKVQWPVQNNNQIPHTADASVIRAFDDTGKRMIVRWWQDQQTNVSNLAHPAVVRLLLPPSYSFGVDPESPLIVRSSSSDGSQSSSVAGGDRNQRIEVQIKADEDALGTLLKMMEDSALLHFREEPIPVVLPTASPTELRADAETWCTWYMVEKHERNCDGAPSTIRDLMRKLNAYADDIEKVRDMRALLPAYAEKVAGLQRKLTEPIATWIQQNISAYKSYIQQQKQVTQLVQNQWMNLSKSMRNFHDKTNMPFCMNQRFETPIFSLLDEWMPSRSLEESPQSIPGQGGRISGDNLPAINVVPPSDILIDFSHIVTMTGTVVIPVLQPVQVRLKIPLPTADTTVSNVTDTLPDLPSLQGVTDAFVSAINSMPKVQQPTTAPAPLDLPPLDAAQIQQAQAQLTQMGTMIGEMNDQYDRFWKSLAPLRPEDDDDGQDSVPHMKRNLECKGWDTLPCVHVEMDLLERIQRIGSRPMVLLREDFDSKGVPPRLSPYGCLPDDDVCLRLHAEDQPEQLLWEVIGPGADIDPSQQVKDDVRDATLPQQIGNVNTTKLPPYAPGIQPVLPTLSSPPILNIRPASKP